MPPDGKITFVMRYYAAQNYIIVDLRHTLRANGNDRPTFVVRRAQDASLKYLTSYQKRIPSPCAGRTGRIYFSVQIHSSPSPCAARTGCIGKYVRSRSARSCAIRAFRARRRRITMAALTLPSVISAGLPFLRDTSSVLGIEVYPYIKCERIRQCLPAQLSHQMTLIRHQ